MNKQEFLALLWKGLCGLPQEDIDERIAFYNEMIEDRIEEGMSESDAVAQMGSVDDIVAQIVADTPFTKIVKEKIKKKRNFKAWEIVLLILGSPVWLPVIVAVIAVTISVYLVLWALIISLWSVEVSLWACFLGGVIMVLHLLFTGNGLTGVAVLGAGIFCAGISIFFFIACKKATYGILILTKKIAVVIKSRFIGKRDVA